MNSVGNFYMFLSTKSKNCIFELRIYLRHIQDWVFTDWELIDSSLSQLVSNWFSIPDIIVIICFACYTFVYTCERSVRDTLLPNSSHILAVSVQCPNYVRIGSVLRTLTVQLVAMSWAES